MLQKSLLILCVLCAAILIGCSKTETGNSNTTASNSNSGTSTSGTSTSGTSKSGTNTSGTSTTSTSGDKIGIPECDDFLAKYEACVSGKVPEVARAQYQSTLKQWKESWKKMAENPQTKATLAATCKTSSEQAATSMKTFGCNW